MINRLLSIVMMLLGVAIFAILLTYSSYDTSFNSTALLDNSSILYYWRNIAADWLLQIFGITVYIFPIIILVWSAQLFLGKIVSFFYIRFLLLLYLLASFSAIINHISPYKSGTIGALINSNTTVFTDYHLLIWGINILILYYVTAIPYQSILMLAKYINKNIKISITLVNKLFALLGVSLKRNEDIAPLTANTQQQNSLNSIPTIRSNLSKLMKRKTKVAAPQAIMKKETRNYGIPTSIFTMEASSKSNIQRQDLHAESQKLEKIVKEFGVNAQIVNVKNGPVVNTYEAIIPSGVKATKLISLETDIALRMKAVSVRIAIVAGEEVIGVEIPHKHRQTIQFGNMLKTLKFNDAQIPLALGYNITGDPIVVDLATMPHLLIAGTTGSGKSVAINTMILSIIYKLPPAKCKMIMIDPKMLELSVYQDIPHLMTPVVTEAQQAISILKWVVREMENRYYKMSLVGVRNLQNFNEKIQENKEHLQIILKEKQNIDIDLSVLPYIVVVIDEMADLMLVAGKEVEIAVQRLAQMARAAGIHLVMATQRPSVDVITGTIKANFPTRISFQVSSKIDSRTILGIQGAEQLLGKGDMLYMSGVGRIQRIHAPFVSDKEVSSVVDYLKEYMGKPTYVIDTVPQEEPQAHGNKAKKRDDLYQDAINLIKQEGKISTSFLQRKFQIGYNRAATIVDQLEEDGIISAANHTGKREVLI